MTEQAVTDQPDDPATPEAEANGEQDLNALLSEFESKPEPPSPTKDASKDDTNEVLEFVRQEKATKEREQTDKAIKDAVSVVKGELDIDDDLVEGLLFSKADRDSRFRDAWMQRGTNPEGFNKVLKAMGADLAKRFSPKLDENATASRNAAMAAVRGQDQSAPEPKNKAEDIRSIKPGQDWQEFREKLLKG